MSKTIKVTNCVRGVISPLLANLFLHYCMDEWLRIKYPGCPFERYADDSIIHCPTKEQAEELKEALQGKVRSLWTGNASGKNPYCLL